MGQEPAILVEHPVGQVARIVGLYQALLRQHLEHFFPEAILETAGDRSFLTWEGAPGRPNYRLRDDPDGLGVEIEWFRTRYLFRPGRPTPFFASERRLIEVVARVLDRRFQALFDLAIAYRAEQFQYAVEDLVVTEYLDPPASIRVPAALEALRVAALSTYENRRVSSGAILLGTDHDPADPGRRSPPGAPRYNVRLTAIKSLHRLCDGLRTAFLVDREGDLAWAVDVARWAEQVQGPAPLEEPCPRPYWAHAKATRGGGHLALVLTPAQEIKVFHGGTLAFAFSDARWRLLDIPTRFDLWCQAVGTVCPSDLAARLFQAALNLSEERTGALFVVLRDPARALPQLVAPVDRLVEEAPAEDDAGDPENLSPRRAKKAIHHLVWGQDLLDLDPAVLESLAAIDGAVVTDRSGRLLAFGAILRIAPDTLPEARAIEGARTAAAVTASLHGPVLKVSEDGFLSMFLGGRMVWEL